MLVPDASQGKLGFGLRVYFNTLNPLLALTSLGVDRASRFADLKKLIHQRGSQGLSHLADELELHPTLSPQYRLSIKREQMKVFGTSSCWQAKERQFSELEKRATELGITSPTERSLLLRRDQPFLLPRLFEQRSMLAGSGGRLIAGMRSCTASGCVGSPIASFLPIDFVQSRTSDVLDGLVPDRAQVREMVDSRDSSRVIMAFRLMTTVINYDLSSEATSRRTTESFDPDWQLYLKVAQANSLLVLPGDTAHESVQVCSNREFQGGSAKSDVDEEARSLKSWLAREGRRLLYAPTR